MEATKRFDLDADQRFHERLQRIKHQDDLIEILTPVFRELTRAQWCERLLATGVPHSPAYDSDEALEDPQAIHLGLKVSVEHPEMGTFTTVRAPYSFDGESDREVRPPPTLDEHGAEIRASIARRKSA